MSQELDLYAIMGNPVEHSISPTIHQLFAQQCQQQIHYEKILVPLGELHAAFDHFVQRGGRGLSITAPFKEDAFRLVEELHPSAEKAKAVNNIIINEQGKLIGVNTDGIGLVNDIQYNYQVSIKNKHVLMMGAGGAVRGTMAPFLEAQAKHITIVNRTFSKAQQIADEFSAQNNVSACGYEDLEGENFDIIINGTAASLQGILPPLPDKIGPIELCYDMMYGKPSNPFLDWAKQQQATVCANGLGMVIEQGAVIFKLWRGFKPDTCSVIRTIQKLNQNS